MLAKTKVQSKKTDSVLIPSEKLPIFICRKSVQYIQCKLWTYVRYNEITERLTETRLCFCDRCIGAINTEYMWNRFSQMSKRICRGSRYFL